MIAQLKCFIPNIKVYLEKTRLVNPYKENVFRGEECFSGQLRGWQRWTKPSPELEPDPVLNGLIIKSLESRGDYITGLHETLTDKIVELVEPERLLLVAILRAGLYVATGLAKRLELRGYQVPTVAAGLFHEAGIDQAALELIKQDYPDRIPVFIDGWTGRGVVARELKKCVPDSILATLVDPGHHGDLWGTDIDSLIESAHFTATETLGFSRAYIQDPLQVWRAYEYPDVFRNESLISAWDKACDCSPILADEYGKGQNTKELLAFLSELNQTDPSNWKVNINEVVRSLVNRNPQELVVGTTIEEAEALIPTVTYLADHRKIPVKYVPGIRSDFNCLAAVRLR